MRRVDGMVDKTKELGVKMNIEEYRRRVENMHSVTGVPTYWEALQDAVEQLNSWKQIALDWRSAFARATLMSDIDDADEIVALESRTRKAIDRDAAIKTANGDKEKTTSES